MIRVGDFGTRVPKAVQDEVAADVRDNEGHVVIARGTWLSDDQILKMNGFVEGVQGRDWANLKTRAKWRMEPQGGPRERGRKSQAASHGKPVWESPLQTLARQLARTVRGPSSSGPHAIESRLQQLADLRAVGDADLARIPVGVADGEVGSAIQVFFAHPDVPQRH